MKSCAEDLIRRLTPDHSCDCGPDARNLEHLITNQYPRGVSVGLKRLQATVGVGALIRRLGQQIDYIYRPTDTSR